MDSQLDWQIPLVIASVAFAAIVLYRFRPVIGDDETEPKSLKEAAARVSTLPDGPEKAKALCDAGDEHIRTLGRGRAASAYYLRAMRTDPTSAPLVTRIVDTLARRPRILETLLWRRLGSEPWAGPNAEATRASLDALVKLYEGPLRNPLRARALEQARNMASGAS
ncbi:MAG: hypothetical protein U0169_24170 [Polyangiaceae bacterium]